ncbi:hypothetical protein QBC46DRAFT_447637 [Diplogelasinospora grovesii]|uniref:Uncharacterized protein n=1 Tax=Diplogelasinospora grovesii TaxID=303347 RepID=A0AAN6S793_9PEZI|nr:hypothetical protein QBC46DRAFT_447637 [Diplogelasinospora grovesii]
MSSSSSSSSSDTDDVLTLDLENVNHDQQWHQFPSDLDPGQGSDTPPTSDSGTDAPDTRPEPGQGQLLILITPPSAYGSSHSIRSYSLRSIASSASSSSVDIDTDIDLLEFDEDLITEEWQPILQVYQNQSEAYHDEPDSPCSPTFPPLVTSPKPSPALLQTQTRPTLEGKQKQPLSIIIPPDTGLPPILVTYTDRAYTNSDTQTDGGDAVIDMTATQGQGGKYRGYKPKIKRVATLRRKTTSGSRTLAQTRRSVAWDSAGHITFFPEIILQSDSRWRWRLNARERTDVIFISLIVGFAVSVVVAGGCVAILFAYKPPNTGT